MTLLKKDQQIISIITPFYNEIDIIDAYFEEVTKIMHLIKIDFEILCIDDGSTDQTLEKLHHWHKKDSRIKIYSFSKNFGKEAALTAGIDFCIGDAAILLDADLQDPPSEIPRMIEHWQMGFNTVLMKRKFRSDPYFKKICSWFYYRIAYKLSGKVISKDICDFRLINKKVIDCVRQLREKNRFMKGILSWGGFKQIKLFFDRPNRKNGNSKFNFLKLLILGLNGIFAFSIIPIRLFSILGLAISILSFFYGCYIIYQKVFESIEVPGYASIITILSFSCGILMLGIGIIGEYVGRIYNEVKSRPIYIIENKII